MLHLAQPLYLNAVCITARFSVTCQLRHRRCPMDIGLPTVKLVLTEKTSPSVSDRVAQRIKDTNRKLVHLCIWKETVLG